MRKFKGISNYDLQMKVLNCIGIDDEFSNNEMLTYFCAQTPFINLLATFTNPYDALPLINSEPIDVLFLDYYMQEIDAPAFADLLPKKLPVVIVSSELRSKLYTDNMKLVGFLGKPYTLEKLQEVVKELRRKKSR